MCICSVKFIVLQNEEIPIVGKFNLQGLILPKVTVFLKKALIKSE